MFQNIDFRQVWLLTRYTFKSEWRTSSLRASGKRRKFSPWWAFFTVLSYLGLGAVLTVFLLRNLSGESFLTAASLIALYVALVTASNIFMSFGSGFLSPDEAQIVAPLPISSETFFLSRLTVLLSYSTFISILISLGPAIAMLILGQGIFSAIGIAVADCLSSISASMAVIIVYGLVLGRLPKSRLTKFTGYVQFFGTLLTTGSFLVLPKMNRVDFGPYTIGHHPELAFIPAFWFGSIAGLFHGILTGFTIALSVSGTLLLALLSALSHVLLSKNYQQDVTDLRSTSAAKASKPQTQRKRGRGVVGLLTTHESRAVITLFRAQFRYDAKFRMSLTASIPITLIYFVVAIVSGGVTDPFTQGLHGAANSQGLYMIALFMPLLLMQSISQSDNFKASWIFYSTPIDRAKLLLAVRNTLIVWVIAPFLLILAILFSFFMPLKHSIPHVLILGGFALLFFQSSLLVSPQMPFAQRRKPNRGNFAIMFGIVLFGAAGMFFLGLVMKFGYPSQTGYFTSLALLITISSLLELGLHARLRTKLEREEFSG